MCPNNFNYACEKMAHVIKWVQRFFFTNEAVWFYEGNQIRLWKFKSLILEYYYCVAFYLFFKFIVLHRILKDRSSSPQRRPWGTQQESSCEDCIVFVALMYPLWLVIGVLNSWIFHAGIKDSAFVLSPRLTHECTEIVLYRLCDGRFRVLY